MSTSLHTFIDIFDYCYNVDPEPIKLKQIVIPIIQRDYAQGRPGNDITRIRDRFLDALYKAVEKNPITLDFVYGDIDEKGIMIPIDGQQRLTTLFLLHWYAAKKSNVSYEEYEFLKRFTYETRYSARSFCSYLIDHKPSFNTTISSEIIDQAWFPLDWNHDPTIAAMLVMIDSIDKKFCKINDLWDRLKKGAVTFYFLPIKDMGLTDELYIKMNSRGKPLTLFEHFKAELEHELVKIDVDVAKRIVKKIELNWTDLLWQHRSENHLIDDEFLRYFHFICDILYYKNDDTPLGKDLDEFSLVKHFFCAENKVVKENITLMEQYFDCWSCLNQNSKEFFKEFFSNQHEKEKVKIEDRYNLDLFEDCLKNNGDMQGNGSRAFALNRVILLYAVVAYLLNRERLKITKEQFVRRIRIINNLTLNSEFEMSNSESRAGGNRIPNMLKQVDSIILEGKVNLTIDRNFNSFQLKEEQEKLLWVDLYPNKAESLYKLEDHKLLHGQIGIVGLDHPDYFERFESLFSCDWDLVDCCLLIMGNYSQKEKNGWRYQFGSSDIDKSWINLFHKSSSEGYENTKSSLLNLLSKYEVFSDSVLKKIKDEFITNCESKKLFNWIYYYVKYKIFRPGRYGKYSWDNFSEKPYEFCAMWAERKWSQNTYQPFLKEIDETYLSRDDFGTQLSYEGYYVKCENSAFVYYSKENNKEIKRIDILQNKEGIDIENRIEKYKLSEKNVMSS